MKTLNLKATVLIVLTVAAFLTFVVINALILY
jgi:hypothetical protein